MHGEPKKIKASNTIQNGEYLLTLTGASVENFHLVVERGNARHPNWFIYDKTYLLDQSLLFRGHIKPTGRRFTFEIQFGTEQDLEKWKEI